MSKPVSKKPKKKTEIRLISGGQIKGKQSHIARFVGLHSEKFNPSNLPEPILMAREEPPQFEEPDSKKNRRKRKAQYVVEEVDKDAPLHVPENDASIRRHKKLVLQTGGDNPQRYHGKLEAGHKTSHVYFVATASGEFNVYPCTDWYTFKNEGATSIGRADIPLEEAEKHMQAQRRQADRLIMPKSELRGDFAAREQLSAKHETMDQEAYMAAKAAANPDFLDDLADPSLVEASDDEDVELPQADEAVQAAQIAANAKLMEFGVVSEQELMAGLDKAGQQMNKLLKRERGERLEEDQDSVSSSSEDDAKPSVATVRTDQHALQLRASMNDVSAPFTLSVEELIRVIRECGAITFQELVAKCRELLHDRPENQVLFKKLIAEITEKRMVVMMTDNNVRYLRCPT